MSTVIDLADLLAARQASAAPLFTLPPADAGPKALLTLIGELTETLAEENALLAAGLPAPLAGTADRKQALADRLRTCWAVRDRAALARDQAMAHRLIQAVYRMRQAAEENATRLDQALAASRRRVETVMAAVR